MENQRKRIAEIEQSLGISNASDKNESEQIWITRDEEDELMAQLTTQEMLDLIDGSYKGNPLPRTLEYEDVICVKKENNENIHSVIISGLLSEAKAQHPDSRFVQIRHPNTKQWCLVDRDIARITEKREQLFNDIPIIKVK